jgi:predicted nucleotidyltransferase
MNQIEYKNTVLEIVCRIKSKLDVKDIILFGSYAYGTPDKNSDIDLIVVLNEKGFSKSFKERIARKTKVSKIISEFRKIVPIDLFVYTIDEWNASIKRDSCFINEVSTKGISV